MLSFTNNFRRRKHPNRRLSRHRQSRPPVFSLLSVGSCKETTSKEELTINGILPLDVTCIVSSYFETGSALSNICAAVGRIDAPTIRHRYLQNNERYLFESLEALNDALANNFPTACCNKFNSLALFHHNLAKFNKCRTNIVAWLETNGDVWKQRCFTERVKSFQYDTVATKFECLDTNFIFNNIAVATMLGLTEVVEFLLQQEETKSQMSGGYFVPLQITQMAPFLLHEIALVRGDTELLELILSSEQYTIMSPAETIVAMAKESYVSVEAFNYFVRHPKVNIHALDKTFNVPILVKLILYFDEQIRILNAVCDVFDKGRLEYILGRITSLIEAGADPHIVPHLWRCSSAESVRKRIESDPEYAVQWSRFAKCLECSV